MNIINTGIATNPFIAKSENSAGSSNVKFELAELFDGIDSKTEGRKDDTVNFSSESQFKLNIQRYAYTLSADERNQFVDALGQSGDEAFDKEFLQWLRDSPTHEDHMIIIDPETQAKMDASIIGKEGIEYPEITIGTYGGPNLIKGSLQRISGTGDIENADHLTRKLDQLSSEASKELSDVDTRTIIGTMIAAIKSTQNYLNSSYAIFRTNYDHEIAEQAISKLPMSDGLKEKYRNFLSEIRSFQHQQINDSIDQQEQQIQDLPQYESVIREGIQAQAEGLAIMKEIRESISHSQDGLFGVEDHLQALIRNSEFIEKQSPGEISVMFNDFTDQFKMFDRLYIQKDWGQNPSHEPQPSDPVIDMAFEETQELTNQYILAINAYVANQNNSNT